MDQVLCCFCNHVVTEKDGTICGKAPWEDKVTYGYHHSCENRAEYEQEMNEFAQLCWAESRYRSKGMW